MRGLNDASRNPELKPYRANPAKPGIIPADVNCALCACAALCSHTFMERFTSGRVLRVMWHEIVNRRQVQEFSLSVKDLAIQQHQLSFEYFLNEVDNKSKKTRDKPWVLFGDPSQAGNIDQINNQQWRGMKRVMQEVLHWRNRAREVDTYKGTLTGAIDYMVKKNSENWIFALLVSGESKVAADAGFANTAFGHWNFAYLTQTDIGLKARFIDYQGSEAVRSTWPVCTASGNQLARPGSQETHLIAVHSGPWPELIPASLIHAPNKSFAPKQQNPLTPHTKAATRAAKSPVTRAATHRKNRGGSPRKKSGGRSKSRK